MRSIYMLKPVLLMVVIAFLTLPGCGEKDYSSIDPKDIDEHENVIVFVGSTWSNVTFEHKEHSDREGGNCFQCHSCRDVTGETHWMCRECHAADDPEELCDNDEYHGCTMTQCNHCHEDLNWNPGLSCEDCHTGGENEVPTASSVAISGSAYVNSTLTGGYVYYDAEGDLESGSTYQWYRYDDASSTNEVLIAGATSITYTPVTADEGKYLKFEVTPAAAIGNSPGSPVKSDAFGPIAPDPANAVPKASNVDISGNLWVDSTLTGTYDYYDAEGDPESGSTYQWYRYDDASGTNEQEITGATSITYTPVTADQGKYLKFEVTPAAATGNSPGAPVKSAAHGPIEPNPGDEYPYADNVAISGDLWVTSTLTGTYDYYDAEGDPESGSTYQWYRYDDASGTNEVLIAGATSITYTPVTADEGKYLKFEVTPAAAIGNSPGSPVKSDAFGPIAPDPLNAVPTATVYSGIKVEGCLGNNGGGGGSPAYINGLGASGVNGVYQIADTNRYTVDSTTGDPCNPKFCDYYFVYEDIDGKWNEKVAYKHEDYYDQNDSYWIAWYEAFGCGKTRWWIADSTGYRSRGGGAIAIAPDANSYTPPLEDWGDFCGNGVELSLYGGDNNKPGITGDPIVGSTLTGNYEYYDADGDSEGQSTFRWLRGDTVNGAYQPISGATGTTYTLTANDIGKFIKFEVTPVAATGNSPGTPATSAYAGIGPVIASP